MAVAFARRGLAFEALNDRQRAISDLGEAIDRDPMTTNYRYHRARILIDLGDLASTKAAVEDMTNATSIAPLDESYKSLDGKARWQLSKLEEDAKLTQAATPQNETPAWVYQPIGSFASVVDYIHTVPDSTKIAAALAAGLGLIVILLLTRQSPSTAAAVPAVGTTVRPNDEAVVRAVQDLPARSGISIEMSNQRSPPDKTRTTDAAMSKFSTSGAPTEQTAKAPSGDSATARSVASTLKVIANGPTYVILYVLFMIPTYLLPYLGSNSGALNAIGQAVGAGFNPAFWLHLGCLIVLCILAWARGIYVAKSWLIVFPILALVFDLVTGLNFVPFVPTTMHLCAIIIGVSSQRVAA
ncbi:hypothetical protein JQ615_18040 [Bradyrhizobium jicamae]|uniref:Tetratricopeptide repeat protein n=1 Tax=Bradyrhizobium jicamae TaxID=280332 RepID=A0ABS5FKJ8_9BRAD|nr:hypothetical protein [Bradyrhizobium jicamae]MBR0797292.1 hypothetical protein [Bradyrhizobium jicamae]